MKWMPPWTKPTSAALCRWSANTPTFRSSSSSLTRKQPCPVLTSCMVLPSENRAFPSECRSEWKTSPRTVTSSTERRTTRPQPSPKTQVSGAIGGGDSPGVEPCSWPNIRVRDGQHTAYCQYVGKFFSGVTKNFHNSSPIPRRKMDVTGRYLSLNKDRPKFLPHLLADFLRQGIHRRGINEIAAGISKEPGLQIEFSE